NRASTASASFIQYSHSTEERWLNGIMAGSHRFARFHSTSASRSRLGCWAACHSAPSANPSSYPSAWALLIGGKGVSRRHAASLARVRRSSLIGHIPFVVLKGGQCVMRRLVERARRRRRPEAVFGEVFLADLTAHDLKVDPVLSTSGAQVVGGHEPVPSIAAMV